MQLAASFDLSATLPSVAELCVERLADFCAILVDRPESPMLVAQSSADPAIRANDPDLGAISRMLADSGFASQCVTALPGRVETLGALILAAREPGGLVGETEKLISVLARQIGSAVEQSQLFERTQRVANRLQRALLPDSFPVVPGAAFNAAYRPASDEAEVGGDWYDAFLLPDGTVGISMGDVAGHGLDAAIVMGEVRQAMRSGAVGERSPSRLLEHVNRVINLRPGIGMVTALFGYYEPSTRTLTYAVAGHPPPVLTVEGSFTGLLPGGGLPLGIAQAIETRDWTIALAPRSGVVFYTDGLTEYSRDVLAGEARLIEATARAFMEDVENPAIALQERIFDAAANRDDAATLTLSCTDGTVPATVAMSAMPVCAPIARALLYRFCTEHGLSEADTFSVITAAGEAIANAVEHAYRGEEPGLLQLRAAVDKDSVTIEVEDSGRWRPFNRRDERGRGIALMHDLMDRARITTEQNRTVVTLTLQRGKTIS